MTAQKLNKQDLRIIQARVIEHLNGISLCEQLRQMIATNPHQLLREIKNYPGRERDALAGLNAYLSVSGAPVNPDTIKNAMYFGAIKGPDASEIYARTARMEYRASSFVHY